MSAHEDGIRQVRSLDSKCGEVTRSPISTPATDQVQVASNLNGNGIASPSQRLAGATVVNGNTVLHRVGAQCRPHVVVADVVDENAKIL